VPRNRLYPFLCLTFVVPLLISTVFAASSDERDVRKTVAGFPQSWNDHDMEAFGKLFATDADFVNVAGDYWKGRRDIQLQHAYTHGTIPIDTKGFEEAHTYHGIFKSSTLRFNQVDARFLQSDVAVAHASWELVGDARMSNPRHGLLSFVLVRQGGVWLIASAQNTEIQRVVK
jgi:ketosteroid isomerase-like protein